MTTENGHEITFEDAIHAHLIENRQTLVKQAVGTAIERMAESMKYGATHAAQKEMETFFQTEVAPEIKQWLASNREQIVAQMTATMKTVIDTGLKKQAEEWLKEMDNQYSRGRLIAKMFGAT
jgi:hypothetical protein